MEDMKDLVAKITEEVLKRLSLPEEKESVTLAVLTGFVWGAESVESYLKNNFSNVTCALIDGAKFDMGSPKSRETFWGNGSDMKTENVTTQQEKESLAGKLGGFEKIVIVTPPLWLLSAIARGDDTVYPAMLALRPLLWAKEVTILLDFGVPKVRRSAAFLRIAEDINALEEMGANPVYLPQGGRRDEPKELVTEQDVKDACKCESRRIKIKPGAIVTQLAQDTAKELGVTIEGSPASREA